MRYIGYNDKHCARRCIEELKGDNLDMRKTIEDLYEEFGNEATDEMIAAYKTFYTAKCICDKSTFCSGQCPRDKNDKWLAFSDVCEKHDHERNFVAMYIMSTTVADTFL